MKRKLKEIAEIKSGYHFKKRVNNERGGEVCLVQLKDIDSEGQVNFTELYRIVDPGIREADLLKKGDILFKAKSFNHVAALFDGNSSGDTIATAHFFIIRPSSNQIMPQYLAWYLNQAEAQKYFSSNAAGTTLPIITKKILNELDIVIPSIEEQQKIVDFIGLFNRELNLIAKLQGARKKLVSKVLLEKINKEADND